MTPVEFLRTVYLGDRACKLIVLDGWKRELKIQVDCISRVRGAQWDYYTAEDLNDGYLVFEGVESVAFEPSGPMPNDWIALVSVEACGGSDTYRFIFSAGAANDQGASREVAITIVAHAAALETVDGLRLNS